MKTPNKVVYKSRIRMILELTTERLLQYLNRNVVYRRNHDAVIARMRKDSLELDKLKELTPAGYNALRQESHIVRVLNTDGITLHREKGLDV